MKALFSFALIVLVVILPAASSWADSDGLYMSEALIGYTQTFNNSSVGSVASKGIFSSETGLGYVFSGWFYVGGVFTYSIVNEKVIDSSVTSINHAETFQYYGPALGYMGDNWFFIGHYYAAAEMKDVVTGSFITQNYGYTGTGFWLNIGYKFLLGSFELAPVLSYKNITYNNCRDPYTGASSACNPSQNQTEITPYLTLLFNFR